MGQKLSRRRTVQRESPKENAQCEEKLAAMSEKVDALVQTVSEESAEFGLQFPLRVGVLANEIAVDKAEFEQKLAAMSEKIDSLVQTATEENADIEKTLETKVGVLAKEIAVRNAKFEQQLEAISKKIDLLVLERTEEIAEMGQKLSRRNSAERKCPKENAQCEQKMAAMSEKIDSLVLQVTEGIAAFEKKLETRVSVLAKEKAIDKAEFERKLAAMSKKVDLLVAEKMKEKLAAIGDKIDFLLEDMKEKSAAQSAEPTASIAPGSCDRSMLSNSSEQMSQLPQLETAPSQEGAEEQPCSLPLVDRRGSTHSVNSRTPPSVAFDMIFVPPKTTQRPKLYSQRRVNINKEGQDITNKGLEWEQKECTAVKKEACPSETRAEKKKKKMMNHTWTKHTLKVQEKSVEPSLDAKLQHSLEESLVFLNSDGGLMKIKGLELITRLAHRQPGVLIPKRQEVCQAIVAQMEYQRWQVSRVAMWTLSKLFIHLKRDMDPELVWVAEVLLQKSTSVNRFLHQAATLTLGHMIQNCSLLRCMEALLSGLSDQSEQDLDQKEVVQGDSDHKVAVRESIAAHLLTLVETEGAQPFLRLEQEMLEHFLSTVSRLTQDASERVRSCAEKILAILSAGQAVSQLLAQL